jgi:hypothetical protein
VLREAVVPGELIPWVNSPGGDVSVALSFARDRGAAGVVLRELVVAVFLVAHKGTSYEIGRYAGCEMKDRHGVGPYRRRSIGLGKPGVGGAIVVDGAGLTIAEQDGEVLPADRLAPPFVLDDPGVLDVGDRMPLAVIDQGNRSPVFQLDPQRARFVQGS